MNFQRKLLSCNPAYRFRRLREKKQKKEEFVRKIETALKQRELDQFYRQFVAPGDLVFDVGANVGERSASLLFLGARVVAVEPQERCRERIRARFRGNPWLSIVGAAMGAQPGTAQLFLPKQETNSEVASMSPRWIEKMRKNLKSGEGRFSKLDWEWEKTVDVPVRTLDSLVEEFGLPSFIKIDVEGFEREVLQGLTKQVKALSYEYTPEELAIAGENLQMLDERFHGGITNYVCGEAMQFALDDWLPAGSLIERLRGDAHASTTYGDIYIRWP